MNSSQNTTSWLQLVSYFVISCIVIVASSYSIGRLMINNNLINANMDMLTKVIMYIIFGLLAVLVLGLTIALVYASIRFVMELNQLETVTEEQDAMSV